MTDDIIAITMTRLRTLPRRRRIWFYVFVVLIVALVFMLFQMISYKFINVGGGSHKLKKTFQTKNKPVFTVLGVMASDLDRYKPNSAGVFTCLDQSMQMHFSRVNDDYCDCPMDGSDEPGTDACPTGRYCYSIYFNVLCL